MKRSNSKTTCEIPTLYYEAKALYLMLYNRSKYKQ